MSTVTVPQLLKEERLLDKPVPETVSLHAENGYKFGYGI